MDCRDARDALLRSDCLPSGPLAEHLAGCTDCAHRRADLAQLEDAWRGIPIPVDHGRGRERFLAKLPGLEAPRRRRMPARRWLVAASILVGFGLWGGVLVSGRRASASSDVVERLVDWNLRLARVDSPDERGKLYAEDAPAMASEVERAGLPAVERELADALLANAPWLASNADPLAEADRFNDLADQLLLRISAATSGGDKPRIERYARLYDRVVAMGIESKFDLIEQSGALDFDRGRKLERLVLRDADRMKTLVDLLEKVPDASRKQIKEALGLPRRRPKPPIDADPSRKPKGGKKKAKAVPPASPPGPDHPDHESAARSL